MSTTGSVLVVDDDVLVRDVVDRYLGQAGYQVTITKPFSPRELVLRVTSVLRRARSSRPAAQLPPITDDGLLAFLIQHPGRAFTRGELLEQVWG